MRSESSHDDIDMEHYRSLVQNHIGLVSSNEIGGIVNFDPKKMLTNHICFLDSF